MRYVVNCRDQPSENNCTLTIAGEREEALKAAVEHAISSHGPTRFGGASLGDRERA